MKISELINELQAKLNEFGDLDCMLEVTGTVCYSRDETFRGEVAVIEAVKQGFGNSKFFLFITDGYN